MDDFWDPNLYATAYMAGWNDHQINSHYAQTQQHNPLQGPNSSYDPFLSNNNPLNPTAALGQPMQQNPYHEAHQLQTSAFFQNQNAYQQPVSYHA